MINYNNDLMVEILKNIANHNSIELKRFSESFNIDKIHADWIINDLISKGYIKKNELKCSFDCETTDCKNSDNSNFNDNLKMFLDLTEKGKKFIF